MNIRLRASAVLLAIGLSACGGAISSSGGADSAPPAPESASVDPSPSGAATASASDAPASMPLVVDELAEVMVEDLTLRSAASTDASRIGLLSSGEPAFVIGGPVEADGFSWYQIASVRQPYVGDCGDPEPAPSLTCGEWIGWAAGSTPDGDAWLEPLDAECPDGRDTETYLSLLPAVRLTCAGSDPWTITAYIAPQHGGRGCYPAFVVSPAWLDGCTLLFPQPSEQEFDGSAELQIFLDPDLGACTSATACPLDAFKGSWVDLIGHLDDTAARTCESVPTGIADPPPPPPDAALTVFQCRTRLVVTDLRPGSAPSS